MAENHGSGIIIALDHSTFHAGCLELHSGGEGWLWGHGGLQCDWFQCVWHQPGPGTALPHSDPHQQGGLHSPPRGRAGASSMTIYSHKKYSQRAANRWLSRHAWLRCCILEVEKCFVVYHSDVSSYCGKTINTHVQVNIPPPTLTGLTPWHLHRCSPRQIWLSPDVCPLDGPGHLHRVPLQAKQWHRPLLRGDLCPLPHLCLCPGCCLRERQVLLMELYLYTLSIRKCMDIYWTIKLYS